MKTENGQSLVQALVAIALISILTMVMGSMFSYQNREMKALSQKLASNDLARAITQNLSMANYCDSMFTTAGNVASGSSSTITGAQQTIVLNSIPGPGGAVASLGGLVSPLSNSLKIDPTTGIEVLVTSLSTATLQVSYDSSTSIGSLRPLGFPLILQLNSSNQIIGCSSTASANGLCPSGGLLMGYDQDGNKHCTSAVPNCSASGQALVLLDTSGNWQCGSVPSTTTVITSATPTPTPTIAIATGPCAGGAPLVGCNAATQPPCGNIVTCKDGVTQVPSAALCDQCAGTWSCSAEPNCHPLFD